MKGSNETSDQKGAQELNHALMHAEANAVIVWITVMVEIIVVAIIEGLTAEPALLDVNANGFESLGGALLASAVSVAVPVFFGTASPAPDEFSLVVLATGTSADSELPDVAGEMEGAEVTPAPNTTATVVLVPLVPEG